ncbi:MAG TPA: ribokinase [Acetobacteraceae bacterium]|nr:ribokinase [Acetobacteraceae bacterium]
MADVLVIGSYNRDIVLSVPRFPRPGETLAGSGLAVFHGGKGSNQAVQAARCGARVALRACIGRDEAGDAALALWAAEGIATGAVVRDAERPTGTAVIQVEASGENAIVIIPGANAALPATTELDHALIVLAQLETALEATLAAFRAARATGAVTVLNAAPARPDLPEVLLSLTDLLVVNRAEAAMLAGMREHDPAAFALMLGARHPRGAVVTAGGAGAVWAAPGRAPVLVPAMSVTVVDTTGAGDAFCGALVASLAQGMAMEAALRRASVAGALACTVAGAVPSLPGLEAILAAGG